MKKQFWIITAMATIFIALGQVNAGEKEENRDQASKVVLEVFEKAYPNAKEVEFEKEMIGDKTVDEVEYKENNREYKILFDSDGVILRKEEAIDVELLPEPIVQAISNAYPQVFIEEAEMVMGPDGTVTGYEVEIKTEEKKLEIELDAYGKILEAEQD
jgi:putative PepSY-like beta-lactamase-inhibitor